MTTEFETPPPHGNTRSNYREFVDDLKAAPGQWGVLRDRHNSDATNIRHGVFAAIRPVTEFQVTARRAKSGATAPRGWPKYDIFVRWIGPNGEHQ